jgi:acetyltransferase
MSIHDLGKVFKPGAVAVVAGCAAGERIGNLLVGNLVKGGFAGKIFPVMPQREEFCGLPAYAALTRIGEPVDLALIASPLSAVPAVIRECSEADIAGAVIFADGHGLAAGDKAKAQSQIKEAANRGAVRLVGPGSSGIACTAARMTASTAENTPLPGRLAFISQSRTIYHAILDLSARDQMGFSYYISTGEMLDVDFADLINFLGDDSRVNSIALYLEKLTHFRKFMSAARAVSRVKPIIALRSGRADHGQLFESARKFPPVGEDDIYGAAFKRAGIERVNTFAELFDCADLLAKQPRFSASGLVIVANGRGPGMMAADTLTAHGGEPASLSLETMGRLNGLLSPGRVSGDVIDVGGDASPERYAKILGICLAAPEVEALLVVVAPYALVDAAAVAESLVGALRGIKIPVCAVWLGAAGVERGREILNRSGIPTFETPERAIRGFLHMGSYAHNLQMLQEIPERLPRDLDFDANAARKVIQRAIDNGGSSLPDTDCTALLRAYGIPIGAVGTGIPDYELILGARKDPGFGPVLLCGSGGIAGEVFRDFALALPPLNRVLARQLIEASRAWPMLKGKEDRPPANLVLLEEILIRLSQLVADLPEVVCLDINPLILHGDAVFAASCRVVVEPADVAAPRHLVISSYPSQYEMQTVTKGGIEVLLRPIKPEDAPLLVELFHSLSPTSVYFRFFSPMRELPLSMLTRFSQIDYDRDIVVVASKEDSGVEKILGVARLMTDPDVTSAEFAIVVGDARQKEGIGRALLDRALYIAKERGLQFVWGVALAENKGMLALARSLGFRVNRLSGSKEYEMRIDLNKPGEMSAAGNG